VLSNCSFERDVPVSFPAEAVPHKWPISEPVTSPDLALLLYEWKRFEPSDHFLNGLAIVSSR
jgi:hypothetical protein